VETGNEIQDGGLAATGRPEDRCKRVIGKLERDVFQNAQALAARQHMFLRDIRQPYCAHCSAGTPVRHRVSRFSTGLNSKYSIANITRRNNSVQAKTCAMENKPNQ